jgi:transposase
VLEGLELRYVGAPSDSAGRSSGTRECGGENCCACHSDLERERGPGVRTWLTAAQLPKVPRFHLDLIDVAVRVLVSVRGHIESYESFVIQEGWPDSRGVTMWTTKNRGRYDRSKLRYPSDLTDAEWALVAPLIPPGKRGGGMRIVVMREVVNGLMYILSTGCQWRAIPKDLPPRSTLYDYFDLWCWDGTLERIHHSLSVQCREQAGRESSPTAGIIDSHPSTSSG